MLLALIIALIVILVVNLGVFFLGLFNTKSYSGEIVVHKTEDRILYSLEISGDLDELQYKRDIRLKVVTEEEAANRE